MTGPSYIPIVLHWHCHKCGKEGDESFPPSSTCDVRWPRCVEAHLNVSEACANILGSNYLATRELPPASGPLMEYSE